MTCKHCGEKIEECVDCRYPNICKGYVHPGFRPNGSKQHSCKSIITFAELAVEAPAHRAAIREDSDTVIIEMSKEQAGALRAIFSYIGGNRDTTRRGMIAALDKDLYDLGIKIDVSDIDISIGSRGTIWFTPRKQEKN